MTPIDFFKLQAKNLHKDFKTQTSYFDAEVNGDRYRYNPKYFDIDGLLLDYDIDENNFSLMKAQHFIAKLAGFNKWTDLANASSQELQLAKLLFDNMHKISAEEWGFYIFGEESRSNITFDTETKLEIFTQVFAEVDGHESSHWDYRLNRNQQHVVNVDSSKPQNTGKIEKSRETKPGTQITSLPLNDNDRPVFIEAAKRAFENVMWRMEPDHPELTRSLWNPELYIDEILLRNDMLPIDRDYALSLIDAFLFHHVLDLVVQADDMAKG